jgi:hypothetical protein
MLTVYVPGVALLAALTRNVVLAVLFGGGVTEDESKEQVRLVGHPLVGIERLTWLL